MQFYCGKNRKKIFIPFDKETIIRKAEQSLQKIPVHITDVKAPMSPGGEHDFYSNGDYWWPNPETADGLPYIRRDGETNPDCFVAHRMLLREMRTQVANLTAGYKLTGKEEYAQKAVQMLKEFFLEERTLMNPQLLYAQAIPGICQGRGIGIIDTLHLIEIPVAAELLRASKAMSSEILSGLKAWFSAYLGWMNTHAHGIEEMHAGNNHEVCWHVQAAIFAKFTENQEILNFCRKRYKEVIIPNQMAEDGSFPRELARTKPYGYSIFVLDNVATLCHILSTEQENLWAFQTEDGRGIQKGLDYLYPYVVDRARWPHGKDIQHFEDWPVAMPFMIFAGIGLGEEKYIELWNALHQDPVNAEIRRNTAIRQPYLWIE